MKQQHTGEHDRTARPRESETFNTVMGGHAFSAMPDVLSDIVAITPTDAAKWLRANRVNRPVRRKHVEFLARQMTDGEWKVNGQAIVIGDNEQILDGQHRLLAIIESGVTVESLVVYGISEDAFKTIDTGIVRTGSDALALNFNENTGTVKAVGTAALWCVRIEAGFIGRGRKLSNGEVIQYVRQHASLWECAKAVESYPKDTRPLSVGVGTALYEIFQRKDVAMAAQFIERLYLGAELPQASPEFLVRALLNRRDSRQYNMQNRVRMVIKAWNLRRRGFDETTRQAIVLSPQEDATRIPVL